MREDNILLNRTARKTAGYFLLALVSLVMVFPFLWLIFLTFKSNAEIWTEPFNLPKNFDLRNYAQAIKIMDVPMFFRNSLIVAAGAVTLSFFATFLSSYALARMTFRMKQSIYYVFLSGFAVPIFILLWPLFLITKAFHMINTFWSLILPYAAGNIAFNTLLLVGQLRSFPKEIEEAAIIDGAGILRVLFRIVAPIMIVERVPARRRDDNEGKDAHRAPGHLAVQGDLRRGHGLDDGGSRHHHRAATDILRRLPEVHHQGHDRGSDQGLER
jgi:raffinose/stachyose/melibiose transport system permease protein